MSTSTSALIEAGAKCSAPYCDLHDYLPIKCQFCKETFCADHFRPSSGHKCDNYVATDRIAPPCPFCQTPISIQPNEDPNAAMETHFAISCKVLLGKDAAKTGGTPRCSRARCGKVLYEPITCQSCSKQFCASHRHPTSHACSSLPSSQAASSPSPSGAKASSSQPRLDLSERLRQGLTLGGSSSSSPRPVSNQQSPTKKSRATAIPASPVKAKSSGSVTTPSSSTPTSKAVHNPFSKTDRSVTTLMVSSTAPSSSSSITPSSPASSSPTKAEITQAILDDRKEQSKSRNGLWFSSYAPPSIFGAA